MLQFVLFLGFVILILFSSLNTNTIQVPLVGNVQQQDSVYATDSK